jgi:hypothetical protein
MEKSFRAGQATYDDIIRRMRIAGWITNVADTHIAISKQQWLRERTSLLRYTNSDWLIYFCVAVCRQKSGEGHIPCSVSPTVC